MNSKSKLDMLKSTGQNRMEAAVSRTERHALSDLPVVASNAVKASLARNELKIVKIKKTIRIDENLLEKLERVTLALTLHRKKKLKNTDIENEMVSKFIEAVEAEIGKIL